MSLVINIYTDGASRGNPGPASIAYAIKQDGVEDIEFKQPIGTTTNNQAEYQAMVAALGRVVELAKNAEINIYSDSELMIRQLTGVYRVKDRLLKPLFDQASAYLQQLRLNGNSVNLESVRREHNQQADRLANEALDAAA